MTARMHLAGDPRMLVCCDGCGTLWKVPPAVVRVDTRSESINVGTKLLETHREVTGEPRCPLCGGNRINVRRCQIGLREAARMWIRP